MSTDVQVLTAARDLAAAVWAVKVADEAKLAADRAATEAARKCDELRKRVKEAENHLTRLASQRPEKVAGGTPAPVTPPVVVTPPAAPPLAPAPVPTLSGPRRQRAGS